LALLLDFKKYIKDRSANNSDIVSLIADIQKIAKLSAILVEKIITENNDISLFLVIFK
jgi:hypothetical protein